MGRHDTCAPILSAVFVARFAVSFRGVGMVGFLSFEIDPFFASLGRRVSEFFGKFARKFLSALVAEPCPEMMLLHTIGSPVVTLQRACPSFIRERQCVCRHVSCRSLFIRRCCERPAYPRNPSLFHARVNNIVQYCIL